MSSEHQLILWGVLTLAPVLIAYLAHAMSALGASCLLMMGWVVARILGLFWSPPESMALYPLIDAVFAYVMFREWMRVQELWKVALMGLLLFQCTLHLAFWLAWRHAAIYQGAPSAEILFHYKSANNGCYALELLCCTWGGVRSVAGDLLRGLSDRGRHPHHSRAWPP